MFRGSKPQSAADKLTRGNPGKRAINDAEPIPEGEIKKPAFVKGKAARLWKQYTPDLQLKGVLTAWDVDMFGTWCVLMAQFQKEPDHFTASKLTQLRTLGESFGLLPPGRARMKARPAATVDPAEEFFKPPELVPFRAKEA